MTDSLRGYWPEGREPADEIEREADAGPFCTEPGQDGWCDRRRHHEGDHLDHIFRGNTPWVRERWPNAADAPAPERAGREGDQALPAEGQGDMILSLCDKLMERRKTGVKRYGRPLQAFNGRDAIRDHVEELLDAAAYAEQIQTEHDTLVEALLTLRWLLRASEGPSPDAIRAALDLADKLALETRKETTP